MAATTRGNKAVDPTASNAMTPPIQRRRRIVVISAAIAGIITLLALSIWAPGFPLELEAVGVEPSSMIYFGEKKAAVITLSVVNSDIVDVTYDIPAFEANVGGRWIIHERPQPFALHGGPGSSGAGGISRMSAGARLEEKLVMPGDTEVCRVQVRYFSDTWKSRLMARIGPMGRRCVTRIPWLSKMVWPDPFESMRVQPWKTNTVEIRIPRTGSNV